MAEARILCLFPSGRLLDRTELGVAHVAQLASELPTLIYFYDEA